MFALIAAILLAQDHLTLSTPIVAAAPEIGADSAGYVRIANHGAADRLVAAECACAGRIEIHFVNRSGAKVSMDTLAALDLPAGGIVEIRPGSPLHLMLMDLKTPLLDGASVEMTLRFERTGTKTVRFAVVADTKAAWPPIAR